MTPGFPELTEHGRSPSNHMVSKLHLIHDAISSEESICMERF